MIQLHSLHLPFFDNFHLISNLVSEQ